MSFVFLNFVFSIWKRSIFWVRLDLICLFVFCFLFFILFLGPDFTERGLDLNSWFEVFDDYELSSVVLLLLIGGLDWCVDECGFWSETVNFKFNGPDSCCQTHSYGFDWWDNLRFSWHWNIYILWSFVCFFILFYGIKGYIYVSIRQLNCGCWISNIRISII